MLSYIVLALLSGATAQFKDDLQVYDVQCLGEGVFQCQNGDCILQDRFCDGKYDCKDGSDENFCVNHKPDEKYCNETHQFLCKDGKKCIPNTWVCNTEPDCDDRSDEMNCTVMVTAPNATCKGFKCDGNKCISKFWMCDGAYDCDDKTDEDIEMTCRHALRSRVLNNGIDCKPELPKFTKKEYSCDDKSFCLPKEHMCDGLKDCKDGSDEGTFCEHWHTMCSNFSCKNESICFPERTGAYCDCLSIHQKYNYVNETCESVNNCLDDLPWCSHHCERSGQTFKCTCDEGYTTDLASYLCYAPDPEAILFFSTRNDIRYIKVKSKEQRVIVSGIKQAHGVTYDGTYVYWVEVAKGHEAIVRAHMTNVEETKEILVALGLEDPGDIAIDWLGGNIYFSDVQRGIIAVCKTDGSVCSVLQAKTKRPRFVTLDPRNGKMYWADWQERALIMTSRMDGVGTEILVDSIGQLRPTGLALDSSNERLYFVDGTIKVVKLFDRKVYSLFEEPFHHPYSISVFENTVFWSDWTSESIQTADKLHSSDKRGILISLREPVFDMHIYHPLLVHGASPCQHSGCSHICVPISNSTFSCLCPEGMKLEGKSCKVIPEYHPKYLIIGGGSLFTRIQYDVLGNPETHATHFDIGRVQAMAYENYRDSLYVYDGSRKSINYINMSDFTLGLTRLVAYNGLDNVVDMGYDYVSDNLYILDAGRRMIDVLSLKTKQRTMLYRFPSQEIPISFCIAPDYGRLVMAVVESDYKNEIHIDSIGLDGSDRQHLLVSNVRGPNVRLRYSSDMVIIYLADEGLGIIDYLHPEGTGRERFREFTTSLGNLAVTDTHVFWTDRYTERLYWADVHKAGYKTRRMEFSIFPNNTMLHLEATAPPLPPTNPLLKHACHQNTTPCSHICVQVPHSVPQDMGYKCLCPVGQLNVNNTCEELAACKRNELYCHRSNECFLPSKKCDGVKDCRFGEDEENCVDGATENPSCRYDQKLCKNVCIGKNEVCKEDKQEEAVTCSPTEERCGNSSICIERTALCDGVTDCPDGSDELPAACDTLSCMETEFMCSSGYCIPSTWRCDKALDCADGSDEINCPQEKPCAEGFFQCGDSTCVSLLKRCDGNYDCPDTSDEDDCDTPELIDTDLIPTCHQWEFTCVHNSTVICLPLTARCNGKVECPGRADEVGCDFRCAPKGMYPCKQELMCVPLKQLCNGRNDCADGSDETIEACEKANHSIPLEKLHNIQLPCANGFICDSGQCIEWEQVCNNVKDCRDGSDEKGNCSEPCTSCGKFCHRTPEGPKCVCPHGYMKRDDTCIDIDECALDACSHVCQNTMGSFVCTCHPGYMLRFDHRTCKAIGANEITLFTRNNTVWSIIDSDRLIEYTYEKNKSISDLDYDARVKKMYISVPETGELVEINKNQTQLTINTIANVGRPTQISLDWVSGNVYFADTSVDANCVRVCSFKRKSCARIVKLPSDSKITTITVDPINTVLFYCVVRSNITTVYSATLAGRNTTTLGTVDNCTGLAANMFTKTLYVIGRGGLWKVDYAGRDLVTMYKNNYHIRKPVDPIVFEDYLYYFDDVRVNRCSLYGIKSCEMIRVIYNASRFTLVHEALQREGKDVCDGTCTNVCVNQNGPVCLCPDGTTVTEGVCPNLVANELPIINGVAPQTSSGSSVTSTIITVVLGLFAIYLCVFLYYKVSKICKNRRENYMQVRFQNRPDAVSQFTSSVVELPTAGGPTHEFVNPLEFVKKAWSESTARTKPLDTPAFSFDANISDTESDIDLNETKRLLRIR